MSEPTIYINIFRDRMGKLFAEQTVFDSREKAVEDAEGNWDRYEWTVSNKGHVLDLRYEFSDSVWQEMQRAYAASGKEDAAMDALVPLRTINMTERRV